MCGRSREEGSAVWIHSGKWPSWALAAQARTEGPQGFRLMRLCGAARKRASHSRATQRKAERTCRCLALPWSSRGWSAPPRGGGQAGRANAPQWTNMPSWGLAYHPGMGARAYRSQSFLAGFRVHDARLPIKIWRSVTPGRTVVNS